MPKGGFNKASNNIDDSVSFSTKNMQRGARELCNAMARLNGETVGETMSKLIWEKAKDRFHPSTIKLILSQADIDWQPSNN